MGRGERAQFCAAVAAIVARNSTEAQCEDEVEEGPLPLFPAWEGGSERHSCRYWCRLPHGSKTRGGGKDRDGMGREKGTYTHTHEPWRER